MPIPWHCDTTAQPLAVAVGLIGAAAPGGRWPSGGVDGPSSETGDGDNKEVAGEEDQGTGPEKDTRARCIVVLMFVVVVVVAVGMGRDQLTGPLGANCTLWRAAWTALAGSGVDNT